MTHSSVPPWISPDLDDKAAADPAERVQNLLAAEPALTVAACLDPPSRPANPDRTSRGWFGPSIHVFGPLKSPRRKSFSLTPWFGWEASREQPV